MAYAVAGAVGGDARKLYATESREVIAERYAALLLLRQQPEQLPNHRTIPKGL